MQQEFTPQRQDTPNVPDQVPAKRIFYVHIPKCAGTTVTYLMRYKYGLGLMNVRNAHGDGERKKGRIEGRHLDFAARIHPWFKAAVGHGLFLDAAIKARYPNSFWFTILREPRSRYLSHHAQRVKAGETKEPLESWIRRGALRNFQTVWLAGEENYDKAVEAMETLYDFVGRLDQLERSLAMMAEAAGVRLAAPAGYKANTTRSPTPQLNEELMDLVEYNNALDIRLWNYFVANIWPRQCELYGQAQLDTQAGITLRDRANEALGLAWRGLVYAPLVRIRDRVS